MSHHTGVKGKCCNTGHLTCGPQGPRGAGQGIIVPWLSLGRIPEKQGILSDEKCRLALPFTAHSSLFAVPVTHQTSARGYKRYFSPLTQARMFLSSRCTESPISCEGLLRPASPPGEGTATILPHGWSPPQWEHDAAWPSEAGGGGAGPPTHGQRCLGLTPRR